MIDISDTNDFEKDKTWYGFIDILFSEETDEDGEYVVDIDEIASAGFYLSTNLSALKGNIHNNLTERLNQINKYQLLRFFEVIEYLFEDEDGRETEIISLLHLLQSTPAVRAQAMIIFKEGNLTSSWKNIAALVAGLMYEDDISDMVNINVEKSIDDLQQENVKWEKSKEIYDEDIPF